MEKKFNPEQAFEFISSTIYRIQLQVRKIFTFLAHKIDSVGAFFSLTLYDNEKAYKKLRLISFPWHFILILIFILIKRSKTKKIVYDQPGIHIIFGPPGSGKSSLAYELIERMRCSTKMKPSYINYPFEIPRESENKKYRYKYHNLYKFSDFWRDKRMLKEPNYHIFGSIVMDEAHRLFNPRENRTNEYNDVFSPFIDYAVLVRQNIEHIYMLTQMGKMDIQIMMLAATITEVKIKIGFDYPDWLLETGLFRFKPLGWNITQYKLDSFGNIDTKNAKKFYIKNEHANFDYFNTYATRNEFSHLPTDYPINRFKAKLYKGVER